MAKERKKVKPKPLAKTLPKKRPARAKKIKIKVLEAETNTSTKSYDPNKYFRVKADDSERFKQAGSMVLSKELKMDYYTTENDKGVFYYLILNK